MSPERSTSPPRWRPQGLEAGVSKVTFEIEPYHEIVRLTVVHEDLDDEMLIGISQGWPAVLANLKSLLETGHVLPQSPLDLAHTTEGAE
jgi:hypothetical protein